MTLRMGLLFIAVALCVGCEKSTPRSKRGKLVERLPKVEVVRPNRSSLVRKIELAATVEALKKVDLSARVPGVVGHLPDTIDIGRPVKKDEVLITLDVPELKADRVHKELLLAQAKKQVDLADTALKVAKKEVEESEKDDRRFAAEADFALKRRDRIAELVRAKAQDPILGQEAQKQYEAAVAARESNTARTAKREARVEAAVAEIALSKQKVLVAQAELDKLDRTIDFATIRAPFDGVITKRWVDPGAIIKDPGATLLTVVQMSRVRVLIDVPQRDVQLLNARDERPNPDGKGDPVDVRIPVLAEVVTDGTFRGYVTRVSRSLDPVTRTMRAEIELDNARGYLRPGMFGTASVLVEDRRGDDGKGVLTVPASALVRRGEGLVEVFVVAGVTGEGEERRGVLKRVAVVLGIDDGKSVEVRSGLTGDELVVERGASVIRDGDEVLAIENNRN